MTLADLTEKQLRRVAGQIWSRTGEESARAGTWDWATYVATYPAAYRHIKEIRAELVRRGQELA